MSFDRISGLLFDRPHLYHPGKAETFMRAFGPRLIGAPINIVNGIGGVEHTAFRNGRITAGVLGDRLGRAYDNEGYSTFDTVEHVGIIPIEGTLVYKGAWIGKSSGQTSYQGLMSQIIRAGRRDDIKGVVFEVDSFGGMVNGAYPTASAIRALSRAKPTVAILTDFACSAAYLLASQARQVIIPEFGGAGSIGTVMMHADFSKQLEQDGVDITFIYSGQHKVEGNPYQPLQEDVLARWQAEVDMARDRFAQDVGKGRGKRYSKASALKSEAMMYTAAEAVDLGLADAVGDPNDAFEIFIREMNRN